MSDRLDAPPPRPARRDYDLLWTPQTIIALAGILIVAGTIIGVFWKGDAPTLQLVVGLVIGTFGSSIFQFYFGSSKGSQDKDVTIATQAATPVVVTADATPVLKGPPP